MTVPASAQDVRLPLGRLPRFRADGVLVIAVYGKEPRYGK